MRTNRYSGLKHTRYHKKNRGKGAGDLLSKGWWKSWDRELPEILKQGFYVKTCFRLDLCKEQSFWIVPAAVLQLEPAYTESVQCFFWILNKSLFERTQMTILGSVDSSCPYWWRGQSQSELREESLDAACFLSAAKVLRWPSSSRKAKFIREQWTSLALSSLGQMNPMVHAWPRLQQIVSAVFGNFPF